MFAKPKSKALASAFVAFAAAVFSTDCAAAELRLAVAANFKSTLDALEIAFEEQTGHVITVTSGSTGKLYAQIVNGAPIDVFLAADQERPIRLEESGAAINGYRFTYASGRLALWAPGAGAIGPGDLKEANFRRLAIANPDLAPYGAAALQVLTRLGVASSVKAKLVYGENVGQTFAFVHTGNAEIGFVALSQLLATPTQARGAHWPPPQTMYDPIRQDAVLLLRGRDNPAAYAFMDFLKSEQAAAIIKEHGYHTP